MAKSTHAYTPALSTQNPTDAEHLARALKALNDSITFAFTLQSQIAAIALSERMGLDSEDGYINYLTLCNHMIEHAERHAGELFRVSSDIEVAIEAAKAGGAK